MANGQESGNGMSKLRRFALLSGAAAVVAASSCVFAAEPSQPASGQTSQQPTQQELLDKINALQAQVNNLQGQENKNEAEQAKIIQDVIADADKHTQLMDVDGGITAGWDKSKSQFFIASDDGNFFFHPGIIFQFRYIADYREGNNTANPESSTQDGFEVRRLKFYFDGNVFTKDLTYKFQWQDDNNGGTPKLEWAFGQYVIFHNVGPGDIGIKAGQYKDYVFKEEATTSDTTQLMVERSLANSTVGGNAFGGPLIQGVDLVYTGKTSPIHADFIFDDGDNTGNTDFTNSVLSGNGSGVAVAGGVPSAPAAPTGDTYATHSNFGAGARVDFKVFGDWSDTGDLTGKAAKNDLLDIGGGAHVSQGNNVVTVAAPAQYDFDTVRYDLDAQYISAGKWTVFGAAYGDTIAYRSDSFADLPGSTEGASDGQNHSYRNDWAQVVEGGYFITPALELAARYSITEYDSRFRLGKSPDSLESTFNEIGVGATYFLGDNGEAGNHAKVVLDANYLPNGSPSATGLGYSSETNNKAEVVVRALFQIWL